MHFLDGFGYFNLFDQKLGQNVGERAFSTFICLPHNCCHTWSAVNYGFYYDPRQKEVGALKWNNCRTHGTELFSFSSSFFSVFFSGGIFRLQYIIPFTLSVISTEGALRPSIHPIPKSLFNHLKRPWIDLSRPPMTSNDLQ